MSYLNLYNKRITAKGNTIQERIIREQHDNFYDYLDRTREQEKIIIDDTEYIVSILTRKTTDQEKYFQILAPLEVPIHQGTLIKWLDAIWLVVISEEQHKQTHFRGELKKSNHPIKWIDKYGKLRETYTYIKGNVKGDLKYQTSATGFGSTFAFVYGAVTGDIEIILPINKHTKLLKEQNIFILNDKAWELVDKDDFSYEGIIGLLLKRCMKDTVKDDLLNEIAQINRLNSWKVVVENGYTYSMIINQEQIITTNIYHNNNLVKTEIPELTWEIDNPSVISFDGTTIKGLSDGNAKLKIFIKECNDIYSEVDITVEPITGLNTHYSLEGNAIIKEGGREYTYIARRTYNGEDDVTANFTFKTANNARSLVVLKQIDRNTCKVITNNQSRYGKIILIADDGIQSQKQEITIESII